MQKYVVVSFINRNTTPSEFSASEWPLHITLLANFTIKDSVDALTAQLNNLAQQLRPFASVVEGEAMFGPNSNIAVSLIKPSNELKDLHSRLVQIAKHLGATFDEPRFIENGFRPHATIQASSRLDEGQSVTINEFTLVDMFPDNDISRRRVIKDFKLTKLSPLPLMKGQ